MTAGPRVLYEDNHLLVVHKPAGMSTMGDTVSRPTVHRWAADYLRRKYNKPGRVFVGIVSRLDVVTSGVLVLARTSKAASRLVPQFAADGRARKWYLVAVAGRLPMPAGELQGWIWKDDAARRMRVSGARCIAQGSGGAQSSSSGEGSSVGDDRSVSVPAAAREARLRFKTLAAGPPVSIVAVELLSGRKHQIRAQFAELGHPVWGDRKYGSARSFPVGIALHSWRLQVIHPTLQTLLTFTADPPASWRSLPVVHLEDVDRWRQWLEDQSS